MSNFNTQILFYGGGVLNPGNNMGFTERCLYLRSSVSEASYVYLYYFLISMSDFNPSLGF